MTAENVMKLWMRRLGPVLFVVLGMVVGAWIFGGSEPAEEHQHESSEAQIWTCSMDPQVRQSEPGLCPICGMDLIPLSSMSSGGAPNQVSLSERGRALARIRTSEVVRMSDRSAEVRLLGRVEPNETSIRSVTAWTGGRIDRLHVRATGAKVRAGQVIATLYSPEVFAAHQDLIVSKKQVALLASGSESARQAAEAMLGAARERLRLLGVPDDELVRMEGQTQPATSVAIRSPFSGTVMERLVNEGVYVGTGTPLYQMANLGTLWIQLDAYESDLGRLAVDQSVRVEVEAFPGESIEGKVTFLEPTVDPRRRTAKVRVEVVNDDGRLRPGMFAEAVVAATVPESAPLVVPASAPLFTGRRSVVYVEIPGGDRPTYEARTVRLGPRLGEFYPVVAGLSEGERVVTKGAFVLDADLQIRGGESMMSSVDDRSQGPFDEIVAISGKERSQLQPLLLAYLDVQRALAADDHAGARAGAARIRDLAEAVEMTTGAAVEPWRQIRKTWLQHAKMVAESDEIERARYGFEGLSEAALEMLKFFGNPLNSPVVEAYCPMAFGDKGASWIQEGEKIDNSYFGASMRLCGSVKAKVEPGSHLATGAARE